MEAIRKTYHDANLGLDPMKENPINFQAQWTGPLAFTLIVLGCGRGVQGA